MTHRVFTLMGALAISGLAGCDSGTPVRIARHATSGGVVDSALPPAEALRRFRSGLPEAARLFGGATTRDALVQRFIAAVEQSDTAALRAMMLNRAEFAYLYYPSSPHARRPTRQAPDIAWFLHVQSSQKGISRVLRRHGGGSLDALDYRCDEPPRAEGDNSIWDDCTLKLGGGNAAVERRLFGGIIAREGHYKILSYANDY